MRPIAVLAAVMTTGCGVRALPPPEPPARELPPGLPSFDEPPPREGTSRVLLEADEPAKVVAVGESPRPICTTPCVVDLPYGSHSLVLQSILDEERRSRAEVRVGASPKVFRHVLGERRDGSAAGTVGTSLVALGLLAVATGAVFWAGGAMSGTDSGLEHSGRTVVGVGAGAVLVGIPFVVLGRPTERPGATTEIDLR